VTALEDVRRPDFYLVASSPNAPVVPIELPVVAVVIPAYQAASTVGSVITTVPRFVRHVIVVDDGSGDETGQVVRDLRDPRVDLVELERNQGVGAAVMAGYLRAVALGADVVAKMDADGQMDPDHLLTLITPIVIGRADYTKGNRFLHARELRSMPGRRRFGNAGLSFMTKLASGYWDIFDPTNGYTAIHSSLVPLLGDAPIGKRYFFESSVLLRLSLLRGVVRDVYIPARYPPGATSRLSESRAALQFPWRLLRGFIRRVVLQYFVRDFTAVSLYLVFGLVLSLFGLIWGVWHWALASQAGVAATTGTVMIAVLPIIVGVQLLLQALTLDIANVPSEPIHASVRLVTADHFQVKQP
jgi:glycosyltransferase involved in cell wall biosynthesis